MDSHFNLDAVLSAGIPRRNASGTLLEGIELWRELPALLNPDGVRERAREYLRGCVAQGILFVRSHVDICDSSVVGVRALVEVRDDLRGLIDVQPVAFPQHGFLRFRRRSACSTRRSITAWTSWEGFHTTNEAASAAWRASRC